MKIQYRNLFIRRLCQINLTNSLFIALAHLKHLSCNTDFFFFFFVRHKESLMSELHHREREAKKKRYSG